jgi:hypothetical protein
MIRPRQRAHDSTVEETRVQFHATDRRGIETGLLVRSAYLVISIHDPDRERPRVKSRAGLRAVLQVAFNDVEPTDAESGPSA